jgi:hypothetical protein
VTRITGTLHEDLYTFMKISYWILLRMRNVSDKFVEKIKTHITCSKRLSKICAIYDIMWKNKTEPDRT